MEFLSEDPTYLVGGLGVVAAAFLVLLKATQQGKYLLRALVAIGLALGVLGVERLWVTDNERIENAVYSLAKSVEKSDSDGALAQMTDDVQYNNGGNSMPSLVTRAFVKSAIDNAKFDFLRITRLTTSAGGQTRRGRAEFQVVASGSFQRYNQLNFGTANSTWSLGFKETSPGVWKVNRITPVSLPGGQGVLPAGDVTGEIHMPTGIGEKGPPPGRRRNIDGLRPRAEGSPPPAFPLSNGQRAVMP